MKGRANNVLTFDIEGFIEASHDSMLVPKKYVSEEREAEEIQVNTLEILKVLKEFDQRATFFILGRIAKDMPSLVRQIADAGHEIGCHSYHHRRLFNFAREEAEQFLADARSALERASGTTVEGFRAPDFSITKESQWAFDVLKDLGFRYDSSIYPTGIHDVYGISEFSKEPLRLPNGLIELPMSVVKIASCSVPFGGGGYLRLYPLALTKRLFSHVNAQGRPAIVYLHPFEMGEIVPRIAELSLVRKFRTYVGVGGAKGKLRALLREFQFQRAIDYVNDRFGKEAQG